MILDKLAASTRVRVEQCKQKKPLAVLKQEIQEKKSKTAFLFEQALRGREMSFICEVKKASPSKGIIAAEFPYLQIAVDYEKAGAAAISVLTEPEFFLGNDEYLREIAQAVDIPVLRKDFTIDEYQIYEAYLLGADAVLLICALLSVDELVYFRRTADALGMSCLVEAHDSAEIEKALAADARVIGVNNRDLRDFSVNIKNSLELRRYVPENVIFVSESGIKTVQDIDLLRQDNIQAALIGETFMKSENKADAITKLNGTIPRPKIKICGMHCVEDIKIINEVMPDYCGFIFAPSSRQVSRKAARELRQMLNPQIGTVGVFVDETIENIKEIVEYVQLDAVQLHGSEPETFLQKMKKNMQCDLWKAVRAKDETTIMQWQDSCADMILFDTFSSGQAGGTGRIFDWTLLDKFKRPFVLAGGVSSRNIARAVRSVKPWGVDINSAVETNGRKDSIKVNEIMAIVRSLA
ncbi:bifunctional indole-3-glycerol-phosphate synthase TrpC/phosphoribosylanthranilate isomerase TrpF [Pectinatus sottacetonis]|uniref:bifunctional indole-3-glycerol-phosphate synthase TrpC/phosphoribosylanthranilate isomerase TrpF n=1 Tax=Pectinatus sottacetonis TaxID=1002795 RepID=UPI0018C7009B|nr:bifunctional indole-3-glycerol-phosphate synthase TrpC/phosphoribosylanthranilate isomerase TrpF [Pectinatus sottacetonis]